MNECLTTPQHKKQIGYLTPNSRSVFCAGVSLNIHSFSLQINYDFYFPDAIAVKSCLKTIYFTWKKKFIAFLSAKGIV